ncbi:hypothetical protein Tco_0315306, partial [Tanacetum coccineum]
MKNLMPVSFSDFVFLNDEEDSSTRIETESHKENPEIIDDDDEEEKKDEQKDDDEDDHNDHALVRNNVTGSSEIRNKKMQTPIPSPPRSPMTDLSSVKTISHELTASTNTFQELTRNFEISMKELIKLSMKLYLRLLQEL